ncbi:unnamed protein product [Cuscuta campestris]|uniref:Uncharacterized protein n=1 Tax=Cuscuta campestris TaxID=132261 RepID=A0A484NCN1_9ASTE|nr:unnamed protein product [Cuscuta campestris]
MLQADQPETMSATPMKPKKAEPAPARNRRRRFTKEGSQRRTSAPPRCRKICPFRWQAPTFICSRPRSCASSLKASPAPISLEKAGSARSTNCRAPPGPPFPVRRPLPTAAAGSSYCSAAGFVVSDSALTLKKAGDGVGVNGLNLDSHPPISWNQLQSF